MAADDDEDIRRLGAPDPADVDADAEEETLDYGAAFAKIAYFIFVPLLRMSYSNTHAAVTMIISVFPSAAKRTSSPIRLTINYPSSRPRDWPCTTSSRGREHIPTRTIFLLCTTPHPIWLM